MARLALPEPRECPACGRERHMDAEGRIHRCKSRLCPEYRPLWVKDQSTRLKHGLGEWRGLLAMGTFTGPGADALPWDTDACSHPPGETCSGPKGCVALAGPAMVWNMRAHRLLSASLRRARAWARAQGIPVEGIRILAYAPHIERGVIHLHVAVGWKGSVKPSEARRFFGKWRREWVKGGGGVQSKLGKPSWCRTAGEGYAMASYMAGYMSKGRLEALDHVPARVQPVYVSRELTSRSGVTMRFLRRARRAWREWGIVPFRELRVVFDMADAFGTDPFTGEPRAPGRRRRRPPPEPWVPIEPSDGTLQDYAQLHLAFA